LPICGAVAPVAVWWHRGTAIKRLFEQVALRESREIILKDFGSPDRTGACSDDLYWDLHYLGKNNGRCTVTWRYDHFLTSYAISFDATGLVVAKYMYFSE
jgi:hypothetical protein